MGALATALCVKVSFKEHQKNGSFVPTVKDGAMINEITKIEEGFMGEEANDNDAAVNYALRRNVGGTRENHTIKEVLISAESLPNSLSGRPNTFVLLKVNLFSLSTHDKKSIGGLTDNEIHLLMDEAMSEESEEEEKKGPAAIVSKHKTESPKKNKQSNRRVFKKFADGEKKVEWQTVMTSEVAVSDVNPRYLRAYQFSPSNVLKVELRVEVY